MGNQPDSAIVLALDDVPTVSRATHPLVDSFYASFAEDGEHVLRESISGLSDPHWWKQKVSRWRGAATDAAVVGEGEAWLCAGGLRAGREARDFYVSFTSSVRQNGPGAYLPAEEDRRVQRVEEKLARRDAWLAQLRLAALICLAEAHDTGERRVQHVPRPSPAETDEPLVHVTFELEHIEDEAGERISEVFVVIDVEDHSVPNLLQSAKDAIRSVIEPIADEWRVLPGIGSAEVWSTLLTPEALTSARSAYETGALPEGLVDSSLRLGIRSHYAPKGQIVDATVEGSPVRGLCGQWFVPTANPDELPVCPACKIRHESLAG